MAEFAPGTILAARFELLHRLGSGGIAEVYAARDRVTGSEVAVKVLHAHLAEETGIADRFRRELSITRELDHPGIVRVFDLHEHLGRPLFTMELLRGETLADRLKRGPLSSVEARRIAREACAAVQVAHRAGVVHRDLKPHNMFLLESGVVKLLDFGLARVAGWARLTAQSTVMGTPGYIAPELLGGTGADARADVYSLGATLYEMLTGKRAFAGSDPYEVLRRQREGAPSPRTAVPQIDERDDAMVRRALDPDPERRFLDAGQFLRELGGESVPTPPPAPPSMTAGNYDVVVHHDLVQGGALRRTLAALGVHTRYGWKLRLVLAGKNTLAAGASRETAESIASICQAQGVGAALVPARERRGLRVWLGRNAIRVAAAFGGAGVVTAVALVVNALSVLPELTYGVNVLNARQWFVLLMVFFLSGLFLGGLAFVISWTLFGLGVGPPIDQLPEGDPAVRRLMEGIARRVARLHQRKEKAPPATQMILEDLLEAAERLREAAARLADKAASMEDPLTSPEVGAVSAGAATARDAAVQRLLEIASALDDALAAAPDAPSTSLQLKRMHEETAFARRVLPELEAMR
jgi:hypothetical protein